MGSFISFVAASRIRDVYPLIWIRIFFIPDSGTTSENLSILPQKIDSKLSEIWSGLFIPDRDPDFLPVPDPGVKKALFPGSATLLL